jgi:hypothetical protein
MLTINNNVSVIRDIKQNILYSTQNGQLVPKEATNMTMYITTDTQEIFFGNELKEFVLYSGENDLTAAEIETMVKTLIKFDVDDMRFQLTVLSNQNKDLFGYTIYDTLTGLTPVQYVPSLEERLNGYIDPITNSEIQGTIETEIAAQIGSVPDLVSNITQNLTENYYNKTTVNTLIDNNSSADNISYDNRIPLGSNDKFFNTEASEEFALNKVYEYVNNSWNEIPVSVGPVAPTDPVPANNDLWLNTSDNKLYYYNTPSWLVSTIRNGIINVQSMIEDVNTLAKTKIDADDVEANFASQEEFNTLEQKVNTFASIKNFSTEFESLNILTDHFLSLSDSANNGIYKIKIKHGINNLVRHEFLIVNNIQGTPAAKDIVRITFDGTIWKLFAVNISEWEWKPVNSAKVSTINSQLPDSNGNINITADSINDSSSTTRKWNNLLPQSGTRAGSAFTSAINPEGRTTGDVVGNNSIAFGNGSAATVASSIALGNTAKATAENAAQIGIGTNNTANSLQFMDKHVVIGNQVPGEIKLFGTAVIDIPLSGWEVSTKTYVATLAGVTSDAIVWIGPNEDTFADYIESEIRAVAQSNGTITFKCTDLPTRVPGNVKVNVTWRLTSGTALLP